MSEGQTTRESYDVVIVGGGVAGLSAGIFTARADLETLVVQGTESILKRSAHLENYPGFPFGVNPRVFVDMVESQAEHAGCTLRKRIVDNVTKTADGFDVRIGENTAESAYVVAASWPAVEYLDGLNAAIEEDSGKQFISAEADGRTAVDGLYAAGRLANQYHQAIVSAGHGAQVAITLIHDARPEFYHDWVVPDGYFTNRGYEIPPGCEEIDTEERAARERESISMLREYLDSPEASAPIPHPSLRDD